MAVTPSNMRALGTTAPEFSLPDPSGKIVSKSDYAGKPLLVVFMCNHCPYVLHIIETFARTAKEYQDGGVSVVAISANDVASHPQDGPDKMAELAETHSFTFPYLYDESQAIAKAYDAACTPDFFLYDADHHLVYRGQFDASRPGNDVPVTGRDLTTAVTALTSGGEIPTKQEPATGCNIKWKPGNEPGLRPLA